jgi:protocatechuate 3,4-dioxygenase beta subunit
MSAESPRSRRIDRRRALNMLSAMGAGPLVARALRGSAAHAAPTPIVNGAACVLTPSLTEGPYFVDERLNRSDLTSNTNNAGVVNGLPLMLNISLHNVKGAGCRPVAGVQVDVWHASAIGQYSDVPAGMGQASTQGETWLRGYQTSDANGNVLFKTVYPGGYSGRAVHAHIKLRTFNTAGNTTYEFNSQLFFDEAVNDIVMARSAYNARGSRRTRNAQDYIYGNNTSLLVDPAPLPSGAPGYIASATLGMAI